jgi:hypothetical protein
MKPLDRNVSRGWWTLNSSRHSLYREHSLHRLQHHCPILRHLTLTVQVVFHISIMPYHTLILVAIKWVLALSWIMWCLRVIVSAACVCDSRFGSCEEIELWRFCCVYVALLVSWSNCCSEKNHGSHSQATWVPQVQCGFAMAPRARGGQKFIQLA